MTHRTSKPVAIAASGGCRRPHLGRGRAGLFAAVALLCASGAALAEDWRYRVRPGDNLWELARTYVRPDVSWERLQAHNAIADPFRLRPGSLLRIPVAWLQQQPASARIVATHGDVAVIAADGSETAATRNRELGIGTTVRTATDASLTLQFADGSRLTLAGNSELALDRLSSYGRTGMVDTRLRLPRGRASNAVMKASGPASGFSIETPDVVAAVRGTEFRVASEDGRSRSEVLDGRIDFDAGEQRLVLEPGQGAIGTGDAPPRARMLLPAPDAATVVVSSQQLPATVNWRPVPGAAQYRVQAGESADFLTLHFDALVPAPPARLEGVENGSYALRVRAVDAEGLEGYDAVVEARIAVPPPFTMEPLAGAGVTVPRPRFRWAGMGDGVRYHFQLATDPSFGQLLADQADLARTELRLSDDLPPGAYVWRVAALTGDGQRTAFSDAAPFTVEPPGSEPGLEPDTEARGLHLRWPAGAADQRYLVQVSRRADFSRVKVEREVDSNEIALPEIRSGTWHVRMAVIESDGYTGPFGPAQQIRLGCGTCRWLAGGALVLLLVL